VAHLVRAGTTDEDFVGSSSILVMKICFWLICTLAIPLILSIVLSMFPLFGIHGQKFLLQLHLYIALLLALAVIVHGCLVIRSRVRK